MNSKQESSEIAELFIKQFVWDMMINHLSLAGKTIIQKPRENYPARQAKQKLHDKIRRELFPARAMPARQINLKPMQPVMLVQMPPQKARQIKVQPAPPSQTEADLKIIGLEKISRLMKDPAVLSIECPGPEKPLLVNSSGAIKTTNIILAKEEIDEIMTHISQRTRIPILSGMFKAAFDNFLMTAVISEFVGTRFTIQKKNPFVPPSIR